MAACHGHYMASKFGIAQDPVQTIAIYRTFGTEQISIEGILQRDAFVEGKIIKVMQGKYNMNWN